MFLLKLSVTAALLIFILHKVNIQELLTYIKKINLVVFALCILLYVLAQLVSSYRWQLLLRVRDIRIPLGKLLSFYFVGMFFNMFLPTLIGGDLVRSYDLSRYTKKISDSVVSVFTERAVGLLGLMLIVLVSLSLTYQKINEPVIVFFVLLASVVIILGFLILSNSYFFSKITSLLKIFKNVRVSEELDKIHHNFLAYRHHKLVLFKVLNLSFLVQLLNIFIYYVVAQALGINISFFYLTLFVPIIILIAMLPISFQGLGLREGATIYLFGKLGINASYAFSLSLICFAVVVVTSLWGGVIFLARKKEKS